MYGSIYTYLYLYIPVSLYVKGRLRSMLYMSMVECDVFSTGEKHTTNPPRFLQLAIHGHQHTYTIRPTYRTLPSL